MAPFLLLFFSFLFRFYRSGSIQQLTSDLRQLAGGRFVFCSRNVQNRPFYIYIFPENVRVAFVSLYFSGKRVDGLCKFVLWPTTRVDGLCKFVLSSNTRVDGLCKFVLWLPLTVNQFYVSLMTKNFAQRLKDWFLRQKNTFTVVV